jgi:MarR family transcriptional regulator, organic hydroperoxide resistance regulator
MKDFHMRTPDLAQILLDWSSAFIRLAMHDLNRFSRSAGLSLPQVNVLMHLFYQGPSEVTNLCEMMQVSPAGASQMIERMVQQGVVQRGETPGDRRVRLVHLTEEGRQVVSQVIAARQDWIEKLIAPFSAVEREQIATSLERLNEQVSQLQIHPF